MNEVTTSTGEPKRSAVRSAILHLAFVVTSSVLLSLGVWQLNRAAEKREMLASEANSAEAAAVPFAVVTTNQPALKSAASQYTRVNVTGVWKPEKQLLWDNRIHQGKAGYEVLTPLLLPSGETVLINRGWVPVGRSRDVLPEVSWSESSVGKVTLEGIVTLPSKGLAAGPAVEPSAQWPKRVQYLDYEAFSEALNISLVPILVQGRQLDEPSSKAWHLVGNWQPTESFGPSRHLGYAFQWFALLATLIFLYVWYELKWFRTSESDD